MHKDLSLDGECGTRIDMDHGVTGLINDVRVSWRRLLKTPVPRAWAIALDGQALVFASLASLVAGVFMAALSSYLPGREASRTAPATALRQE